MFRQGSFVLVALAAFASTASGQLDADFSATPLSGTNPLTVAFVDETTGGPPTTFVWDFGDGSFSVEQNPVHTYTGTGEFTVSLSVLQFPIINTETKPNLISVEPADLTADFIASPESGINPLTVSFTDTSTGVSPTAWSWTFGDGSGSDQQDPTHTYTAPGTYTVSLTVFFGQQAETILVPGAISVSPAPVTPAFSASPDSGVNPLAVSFTDETTGTPPTAWSWSFGDGGTSSQQDPMHTYTAPGSYTVSLTVFIEQQSETIVVPDAITVDPAPLMPDFTASPTSGPIALTVDFTDTSSGTPPTARLWEFGDGGTSTEQHPTHTYLVPGTFDVSLTLSVFDQQETLVKRDFITSQLGSLSVDFSVDLTSGPAPLTVQFVNETRGLTATGWSWDFGDGSTSSEESPIHVYTGIDSYSVTLTAFLADREAALTKQGLVTTEYATTLNVPGDAATIQGAIDLAPGSAQILVAPGVYEETLDFGGKTLALVGTAGAGATVIDASGTGTRAIDIPMGSSVGTLVRGFTVTGGDVFTGIYGEGGGGIRVQGLEVRIIECALIGNAADSGGGISGAYSLEDCLIKGNTAQVGGGAYFCKTVLRCAFESNTAQTGGGLSDSDIVDSCLFKGNAATYGGGGGIAASGAMVRDCVFIGNSGTSGGGYFDLEARTGALAGCVFIGNTAKYNGGAAILFLESPSANYVFSDLVLAGNSQPAFYLLSTFDSNSTALIENATLVGDGLTVGPSSFYLEALTVVNSIIRDSPTPISVGVPFTEVAVRYSNIEGGWPGVGNIDVDPLLIDPANLAFGLLPGSPCIDAGDPTSPPDDDGSLADMGAVPFGRWCDLSQPMFGTNGLPLLAATGDLTPESRVSLELTNALEGGPTVLVLGLSGISAPFKCGVLVPSPDVLVFGLVAGVDDSVTTSCRWPTGIPSGSTTYYQWWIDDPAGPVGFAASNAVSGTTP